MTNNPDPRFIRRGMNGMSSRPRELAALALQSLVRYRASGLVKPEEHVHEELAVRLVGIAARDSWE